MGAPSRLSDPQVAPASATAQDGDEGRD